MNERYSVQCPICKSDSCTFYTKKNGYDFYKCGACRLLYIHPTPSVPVEIYDQGYFDGAPKGYGYANYDEDKEPMRPAFLKYLSFIRSHIGTKGRLLDVGAATGYFVQMATEAGYEAEGIDVSEYAVSLGRKKGLRMRAIQLENVQGEFDCITMFDLLEHVPDPRATLQKAHSLLRGGGILVINMPDAGSLVARVLGPRWHLIIPPEHVHLFDRRNIAALLKETGFEVNLTTTIGKRYTFKYIFTFLHAITGFSPFGWLGTLFSRTFLSRLYIPINLRDNMFVIAIRK